jgi:hypothetical protein
MGSMLDQLVNVLVWAGVGILVFFIVAFYLFHALKKDGERRDKREEELSTKERTEES